MAADDQREVGQQERNDSADLDGLVEQGYTGDQVTALKQLRQQHAAIYRRLSQMTPRSLRIELVNIYASRGKAEIDRRFFGRKE